MRRYTYKIQENQYLNRWVCTDVKVTPFLSESTTFEQPVNLTEEYVQIVYPVRQQFLDARLKQDIQITDEEFTNTFFPFENTRIEYSSFIHTPHTLKVYGKTFLTVQENKTLPFLIGTCGSAEIWVNGEKQVSYTPYTRNLATYQQFDLSLEAGDNEIVLYMDDLAERDVNYFVEIKYIGKEEVEGYIPAVVSEDKIKKAEAFLTSINFTRDLYRGGKIAINHNSEFIDGEQTMFVNINRPKPINAAIMTGVDFSKNDFEYIINENTPECMELMPASDIKTFGLASFEFGFMLDGKQKISRKVLVALFNSDYSAYNLSDDIATRKEEALKFFSEQDFTDVNIGYALTHLTGKLDEVGMNHIRSVFKEIENKGDCADFRLAPLLAFAIKYKGVIPAEYHAEFERLALDFRYWIDEPGNDVMWYFSENHALLFHISQYFAGYMFPEKTFTVSGRTGKEQYKIGKERLEEWFETFLKFGYGEWNSTTYFPVDFIGFFSLFEAAPDENIRELARKSMDMTFELIAINLFGKTMSTTYGRVYEHDLKAMELGEISNIAYIAWKQGCLNTALRTTTLFCMSSYVPPKFEEFFIKDETKGLVTQYIQGVKEVYTYNFKTKNYCISSAINFNAFAKGHQQHSMNISLGENAQMWVNHPGETVYSGDNRPSFWAGNGSSPNIRQFQNYMFMEFKLNEMNVPFIHSYLPFWNLDEVIEKGNWIFARNNKTYIALNFSAGYKIVNEGATANREIRSEGKKHQVFINVSCELQHGSFEKFVNEHVNATLSSDGDKWSYKSVTVEFEMNDHELYHNQEKIEYTARYEIEKEEIRI